MRTLGNIALAKNHDGRMELFAMLGPEPGQEDPYSVLHRWQETPDGDLTEWKSLGAPDGGSSSSGPAVARNSDGRLEIVVGGLDGALWHRWQRREGGWSDWTSLAKPPGLQFVGADVPTLVYNGDARLELFTRGSDGAIWHRWQLRPSSGWSAWSSLQFPPSDPLFSAPVVARNKDWRLELFEPSGGVVWTRAQRAEEGWSDWESLGGPEGQLYQGVLAAQNRERSLRLFTGDSLGSGEGELFESWQFLDGGWSPWRPVAKPPRIGLIRVGAHADGRLVLFGLEAGTRSLWKLEQVTGSWTEWQPFYEDPAPGEYLDFATLALNAKGQLELWFMIENTMDLYRLKQTTPNGTEWNGERFSSKEPV
jgi:hypothetical protein